MIDISSKSKDLRVSRLSNFTERHFQFSGFECVSVESLLQALKTGNLSEQQMVCQLDGRAAKSWGLNQVAWKSDLMLWWDTHQIGRLTRRYQQLLTRVYDAVFKCDASFKTDLHAIGHEDICHSIGNPDPRETVLTEVEMIHQLNRLRLQV